MPALAAEADHLLSMRCLGIIPARGGSKSIPRKNLAPLGGRPLIAHTCEAARAAARLDRVILSTDDAEIAETVRALGVDVPFMRPASLAGDTVPMLEVLQQAVRALEARDGDRADVVVLLQPTSPLRRARHIDEAVALLEASGADSVVSVVEVPHQFTPGSVLKLDGERVVPYESGPMILRRQDKPRLYARNGPAIVVVRRQTLLETGTLYGPHTRPYPMTPEDSIDIDGPLDLEIAAFFLARETAGEGARQGAAV